MADEGHRQVLPGRDEQWQLLLPGVADDGAPREVGPGRIEVVDDGGQVFTVVVSPDQWEQVLRDHAWGDLDLFFADLLGPRQSPGRTSEG